MKDLVSIKYNFDLVLNELDFFYPVINSMFCKGLENRNYELFAENVKELHHTLIFRSLSRMSLKEVASDAKLFLDENIQERFYLMGKNEIRVKKIHLNDIIKAALKPVSKEDSDKLEATFFENFEAGYSFVPRFSLGKEYSFPDELIKGITKYFDDFESAICQIRPTNNPKIKYQLTGFVCNLNTKTVEEIYNLMVDHKPKAQIKGRLKDFKAIFANEESPVEEPINWLIKHGINANNNAFHTFLRLMLDCREKELTRETLRKANKLFLLNNKPLYPNDKIKYPGKGNERWMISSIVKHFSKISSLIEKTRP